MSETVPLGFTPDSHAALTDDITALAREALAAGLFDDPVSAMVAIKMEIAEETHNLLREVSVAEALFNVSGIALAALGRVRVAYRERIGATKDLN